MKTKTPITTSIMSFKTFRSPDKITYNEKKQFFIHHPNLLKSKFYDTPKEKKAYQEFIESFNGVNTSEGIRNINPVFFDFSSLLMLQKKNDSSKKPLKVKLPAKLKTAEITKIWDELFYQIATQKSISVRQACVQMIITQHYIENQKTISLKDISKLSIVIPQIVINFFKPWVFDKCNGELFGVQNLGIQEYRRVEQILCCYVPGEVSHIENIMAKEYKEKSTRNLLRTEYSTEFTSETEIENLNDTTTTERNEISSKILEQDKSFDISGSVTVNKDTKLFGNVTANVSTGYSSNNSSSLSNTEAKNYAKEVTERALERIVQKTTVKRTYKMLKEFEEKNKHGLDNRKGDKHVTGVYRWVDKIYDNQLVNYGKRLLFEADIPNPSLFYKKAMQWKSKTEETASNKLTPPKTLQDFGLSTSSNIIIDEKDKINEAASYYGINIEWPKIEKTFSKSDNYNVGYQNDDSYTPVTNIPIEANYGVYRVVGSLNFDYKGRKNKHAYLNLYFGSQNKGFNDYCPGTGKCQGGASFDLWFNPNVFSNLPVYLRHRFIGELAYNCTIYCRLNNDIVSQWQNDVFAELQQSYNQLQAKYEEELKLQQAAQQAEGDQNKSDNYSNSAMNRLIEERELKRICIEMMSKPYCYDLSKNFNQCKTHQCKTECSENENIVSHIVQNENLENYAKFIKFFETAFQWEIMTYVFYPYYYNQKCDWSELLQTKNDDPILKHFYKVVWQNY